MIVEDIVDHFVILKQKTLCCYNHADEPFSKFYLDKDSVIFIKSIRQIGQALQRLQYYVVFINCDSIECEIFSIITAQNVDMIFEKIC